MDVVIWQTNPPTEALSFNMGISSGAGCSSYLAPYQWLGKSAEVGPISWTLILCWETP